MTKKPILAALVLALVHGASQATPLSEADRKKLTTQLEALINQSSETLSKRQGTAYHAYKAGLRSDTAAIELYLDCVERVDFLDSGKKTSDFRDWKRKHKERLADPGFQMALRHQLNWLVLSIEAARSEAGTYDHLSDRAQDAVSKIFQNPERLKDHHGILRQDAMQSVFAKAYGFGTVKIKDWPKGPLAISAIYDKIVFPPLRRQSDSAKLRKAWQNRIHCEGMALEEWSPTPSSTTVGMKRDMRPPAYEKFLKEAQPELVWKMELDVFKAGDQRESTVRMLTHISNNMQHNKARDWARELHTLVAPTALDAENGSTSDTTQSSGGFIKLPAN